MQSNNNLILEQSSKRGHILLLCSSFFSYHILISATLRTMGYDVTLWDDRVSNATWYKLILRLCPNIVVRWSEHSFLNKLRQLDPTSITHVLVIRGEGLSRKVISAIREKLNSASMGLYLWDGIKNIKGVPNILSLFDSVATFDPIDAKNFDCTYRPLFSLNQYSSKNTNKPTKFDWCFIGTIHSDRHYIIHSLRRCNQFSKCFVFGYFQSPLILFINMLMDWTLWLAPNGTLSTKPMPTVMVAEKIEDCVAVLDIEHPHQHGLTIRTIETLMAGKKLITTNKHILSSNLYHPSRVYVINRSKPDISADFFEQPYLPVPDALKNYYSCEVWLSELLELQDCAKNKRNFSLNAGKSQTE